MKPKQLLHQINNARTMLNTAAEECARPCPDLNVIFDNIARPTELCFEAQCLCSEMMAVKRYDEMTAKLEAVLQKYEKMFETLPKED
jgi:hypothetical protein